MDSDPKPEITAQTGDALSRLHSKHLPKEVVLERYYGYLKNLRARVALCAAALVTSSTLLIAVLGAFYSVSSEPVLVDSPEARSAVASCDARADTVARQHCLRRLVARAVAQDAGASQVATLAPHRRGAGR